MLSEENLLMAGITITILVIVAVMLSVGKAEARPSTRVLAYEIVCTDTSSGYCSNYNVYKVVQE